ncbi:hypothetical protein ACN4GH_23450, partial [Burkholderia pseudomallei]
PAGAAASVIVNAAARTARAAAWRIGMAFPLVCAGRRRRGRRRRDGSTRSDGKSRRVHFIFVATPVSRKVGVHAGLDSR